MQLGAPGARARRVTRGDWSVADASVVARRDAASRSARIRARDADLDAAPAVLRRPGGRRRAARGGAARRLVQLRRLVARRRARSRSSASTRRASHSAARSRSGSCPRAGGRPRDLAPGRHLHVHPALASDLVDWEVAAGGEPRRGRAAPSSALSRSRGRTALWRFPLDGEPGPIAGSGPHVHGYAAGRWHARDAARLPLGRARAAPRARARRPARAHPRRRRHGSGRWRASRCEQVVDPGPGGPDPRDDRRAPRAPGAGALPLVLSVIGGPGGTLGSRAVAARPGARGCGRAHPHARPARLGELRPRLARGDPRGVGRRRRRRPARRASTGRWGRGSPIPRRLGVTGLSYGGFMTQLAGRPDRPLPRRGGGQRRRQPGLGRRELRRGRALDAAARLGLSARRLRAPLAAVAAGARRPHHDAAPDAPGRGRPALPAGRQRAALRGAARAPARRSSTSSIPRSPTSCSRSGRPDRRIDMLERTQRWFRDHGVLGPA